MVSLTGVRTCSIACSGQRGILLQPGLERTARHEQEVRRQEDEANHSQARALWFSRLHGRYWMIALLPSRDPTSSRERYQGFAYPLQSAG